MRGVAFVDGVRMPLEDARLPVADPAFTTGWAVFETLQAEGGRIPRLHLHLARLAESCAAACIPPPDVARLEAELFALTACLDGAARLRVTITGGGARVVVATPVEFGRLGRPVRAARGVHRDEPVLGGRTKHTSRAPWVVAVTRAGVDEVLLVDAAGRFTEGTTAGIVAVIGGTIVTAPDDGRILQSTTVAELVRRAGELGIPVVREGPSAVGPWDGLYIASTTRRLAPVVALDDEALAGWEPIGRRLFEDRGW